MKNKNHCLSENEMELVKLLMAECETTADNPLLFRINKIVTQRKYINKFDRSIIFEFFYVNP